MQAFDDPVISGHLLPRARPRGAEVMPIFSMDVVNHPDELAPDVRALLDRAERRNAEFGASWYRNLIETVYPAHLGIRFFVLRKGRHPIALLPLRVEAASGGQRVSSLSNFYTTLYEPVVEAGTTAYELHLLLAHVARSVGGFATLTLAPMDTASYAYATLMGALRLSRWKAFEYFTFGNWYLPVTSSWADYLKTRDGALRSTLKRMDKKFGNAGFMPGLIRSCAANGSLRLGVAWLDGKAIAAQLWMVSCGRAAIYKLAYHEEFKAYSPGSLLTALLMARALDFDQVSEVDYLCGDDAYKSQWMSQRRERGGIVVYNPYSPAGLAGLARQVVGGVIRAARQRLARMRAPA
jgi:CelD/BcsL family acetyltransferase involved in cellulose biosynthesis